MSSASTYRPARTASHPLSSRFIDLVRLSLPFLCNDRSGRINVGEPDDNMIWEPAQTLCRASREKLPSSNLSPTHAGWLLANGG